MLTNSIEVLKKANEENTCIAQFNINNLEWTKYILEQAEELKKPVILGVSVGASKYMGGFYTIRKLVEGLIHDLNITVDVVLHLDHGKSFEVCKEAIDAGFTSVMIDASSYTLEENIKITKQVVEYAHSKNVSVEAEIGGIITDGKADESIYAKTEDCAFFVEETKVDSLAPALGSVHGIYKGKPKINYERMQEIKKKVQIPLVLHGGTGLNNDIIMTCIRCGINKVNINTELQLTFSKEVRSFLKKNKKIYDPRKIIGSAEAAMKKIIKEKIELFSSNQSHEEK